jgi:putrescine---pyruvate transaminase
MGPEPGDAARLPALWNGFANMASLAGDAVTIARGEGAWVFDTAGRPYLDALASLWYCNVGHGRGELAEAAAEQMRQLAAYRAV